MNGEGHEQMAWKSKKTWVCIAAALAILPLLLFGICLGVFGYVHWRDYKSVRVIRMHHIYGEERNLCEMDVPVKFVPDPHEGKVCRKLMVSAADRRPFMIFLFEDGHIQLIPPARRGYLREKWLFAYYEITDTSAREKVRKLLASHCRPDD